MAFLATPAVAAMDSWTSSPRPTFNHSKSNTFFGIMYPMPSSEINTLPLSAPRFTKFAFPPYRFVPGKHPHPIAHPEGHSYHPPGHVGPHVDWVPPERWRDSPEYLFGCDLYNHGFWWESHEAWEGLWRVTSDGGEQKRFLQGLIQIAAIHLQLFQGHADGVARLRTTSREHLTSAARLSGRIGAIDLPFMGVRIFELMDRVEAYCVAVLDVESSPPWHDPGRFPYIIPS